MGGTNNLFVRLPGYISIRGVGGGGGIYGNYRVITLFSSW